MKLRALREKANTHDDGALVPSRRTGRASSGFMCSVCKYESNRQYNVIRHEDRIHYSKKLHTCCGKSFLTKGEYYIHCEQAHPETRSHAITSRMKYKITSDSVLPTFKSSGSSDLNEDAHTYNLRLRRKYSERLRMKKEGNVKSELSVKYSVTYSEYDIENIPLMSFLTDRRLKSYLKKLTSSKTKRETGSEIAEESNQTVKIALSSEQNIEKAVLQNGNESVQTKVSDSTISSVSVELPTKKLILHRFRTDVKHEYNVPLRDMNNNNRNQASFGEQQSKELVPTLHARSKVPKRATRANKENVSVFSISLEQQLKVNLDRGITVPVVSQLHRDFLSSIDFDAFKIF